MTPDVFVAEAERRLAAEGYAVDRRRLPGGLAVVGQKKPFRVRWVLTQLKTSVVVTAVDTLTAQGWDRFVSEAFEVAKSIRGGLPTGVQSGIAAVPVLAANVVAPDAAAKAMERPHYEWFKGFVMPAVVELSTGRVATYDGRILVGSIYVPFLRRQRDLVTGIVR